MERHFLQQERILKVIFFAMAALKRAWLLSCCLLRQPAGSEPELNCFTLYILWGNTLMLFIMVKKIINVTHVKRHFLKPQTWRDTLIQFINHNSQKNHKCNSCGKSFLEANYLKNTLIQFIMVKKITNVSLVESNFLKQELWRNILIQFIRLVIYCRNLRSNLRRNYGVKFYLANLLIRSRNRGVECGSNPGSNSRRPTLIMVKKIAIVTHVESYFLQEDTWRNILIWFTVV